MKTWYFKFNFRDLGVAPFVSLTGYITWGFQGGGGLHNDDKSYGFAPNVYTAAVGGFTLT